VQVCPNSAHEPASKPTQWPCALPRAAEHFEPAQQSPSTVQVAPSEPHAVPQTNGGEAFGVGLGMHGRLLQQLALVAQATPAPTHWTGAQRGVPVVSSTQLATFWHWPLQQSQLALHDIVANLQMSPSGLQPCGVAQVPTVDGGVNTQVTGVAGPPGRPEEPQQSPSLVQVSPAMWQPDGGMQTNTPVGA
jgi:hypothetical protein